jgi:hypothetical protein
MIGPAIANWRLDDGAVAVVGDHIIQLLLSVSPSRFYVVLLADPFLPQLRHEVEHVHPNR